MKKILAQFGHKNIPVYETLVIKNQTDKKNTTCLIQKYS